MTTLTICGALALAIVIASVVTLYHWFNPTCSHTWSKPSICPGNHTVEYCIKCSKVKFK